MSESSGEKFLKSAKDLAGNAVSAMREAGERIGEIQEGLHLDGKISELRRDEVRCRETIADMVVRMFDQEAFTEALLKPEYTRIKEIRAEITALKVKKAAIGQETDTEGDASVATSSGPTTTTEQKPG